MRRRKRRKDFHELLEKLHNPPNWVAVITIASALVVCPLLVAAMVVNHWRNTYVAIGVLLCVSVAAYTAVVIVSTVRKVRTKVLDVADRYEFTRHLRNDYQFRTLFFGACAFLCNVAYTAFLILTAFRYRSVWYGAIGVYYILLSFARGGVLAQSRKDERRYQYDFVKLQGAKIGTYRYCAIMVLTLAFTLTLSVAELVFGGSGFRHATWLSFVFTGMAIYKVTMAIFHLIRSTKMDDLVVRSVRYINFAVTLMSLLCAQTSILAAAPVAARTVAIWNGITGAIVCVATVAIGVRMLIFASRARKKLLSQEFEYAQKWGGEGLGYNRDGYRDEY